MRFVKSVIDEWDPINLLSHAPNNEYHSEIEEIEQLLKHVKDCDLLAEGIYHVFLKSFGEISFCKTRSECIVIAQKLLMLSHTDSGERHLNRQETEKA